MLEKSSVGVWVDDADINSLMRWMYVDSRRNRIYTVDVLYEHLGDRLNVIYNENLK